MATRGHHNPSTRLGGSAFNHSQSSNAEAQYDDLRNRARQEHSRMASCFDRAHTAHQRGDGAEAHALSEEGNKHKAAAAQLNQQASQFIFLENNSNSRVASDTIDLHGQFVEEADDILEARIRQAKREHQTHLHVIVGKGNHSPGHVQKIKPRVEEVCRELGLKYHTEENAGRIFVDLTGGEIDYDVPATGQAPGKYAGGYQGGYGGGGGYGEQQQQQQGMYGQPGGYGGQQQGGYGQTQPGSYAAAAGGGYPGGQQQQQQQFYPSQQQPQYHQQQQYQQRPPQQQFEQQQQPEKQDDMLAMCLKKCCVIM